MLLSCKLSNTVLLFLENKGEDVSPLLDAVSLPEEFLKDPSYWMPAQQMEDFLEQVSRMAWQNNEENLLQKIAHSSVQWRSWGVLDSVLRMMPRPQEILAQPSRFLANFISPEPPVEKIVREEAGISFEVPISASQYPLTIQFLTWSFETLPVYVGREPAFCDWRGTRLSVHWDSFQKSIFGDAETGHQVSPELLREIVGSLEKHQHELLKKNAELQAQNDQLLKAQQELQKQAREGHIEQVVPSMPGTLDFIDTGSIEKLRQNLGRMTDYLVRSQQLITLLVGQNRMSPAVTEAMRRVDWERVKTQFPKTMEESFLILEKTLEAQQQRPSINNIRGEPHV